jgi:hypothetical protein
MFAPVDEIMPDRCTTEDERIMAKLGAWMPYRRARAFLEEFFPLGDEVAEMETIYQRTLRERIRFLLSSSVPRLGSPSVDCAYGEC